MFLKSNFKGFVANNAQVNWNNIRIIYGSRNLFIKMVDKKCTCLFHWIQSLDKHTKKLIKPTFQDQHNILCHQYKNAKSLMEVDSFCATICYWWLSLGATLKASFHELVN
jgi:hypothetical protein